MAKMMTMKLALDDLVERLEREGGDEDEVVASVARDHSVDPDTLKACLRRFLVGV